MYWHFQCLQIYIFSWFLFMFQFYFIIFLRKTHFRGLCQLPHNEIQISEKLLFLFTPPQIRWDQLLQLSAPKGFRRFGPIFELGFSHFPICARYRYQFNSQKKLFMCEESDAFREIRVLLSLVARHTGATATTCFSSVKGITRISGFC